MNHTKTPRLITFRAWLLWTISFLVLPVGGYAGTMISGRIDNLVSAVTGGAMARLIIGPGRHWEAATGSGQ